MMIQRQTKAFLTPKQVTIDDAIKRRLVGELQKTNEQQEERNEKQRQKLIKKMSTVSQVLSNRTITRLDCRHQIGKTSAQTQEAQRMRKFHTLKSSTRCKRYCFVNTTKHDKQQQRTMSKYYYSRILHQLVAILVLVAGVASTTQLVLGRQANALAKRHMATPSVTLAPTISSNNNNNNNANMLLLAGSADVELSRTGAVSLQRLQRDASGASPETPPAPVVAMPSQAATCGYPGSPAHASVSFNTTHVVSGTAATYTCDNGYELLGPPRRICQANGSWSPVGIPFCVLNVGLGKAAMQSSTAGHGSAQKAVDGSTSPYFQASTCTMTDVEHNPWWYVNLLEPYLVQIVRIDFGTACCANRQKATIAVRVGNNRPDLGTNPLCNRYHGFIEEGKPLFLPCTRPAPGAFVSIHMESPSGSALSICETFIYTDHALSIEQCPSFRDQPLGSTATYNGKCYLFHNNQALQFDGARKYCESRGGTLVDETSPALQGFLSWELYRRHRNDQLMGQYWLGAVRDTRNTNNWKWINGRDVQISFWNSLSSSSSSSNSAPNQQQQGSNNQLNGGQNNNSNNCSRFDGSKGWLWSDTDCQAQLNFICQYRPLSCGKPEKPTNSTLVTKNIDNGTVIEYQCAPGNLLMGPKSRVCLPTGFFSEFAPKCKYLDCQFPAQITNGAYKLLNSTTSYQSLVTYYCNDGYQLYGRSTLTCDVDERWNGPPPRCEPLLCSAPVAPSNGYVTVTSNITTPGTQATYECRPGYELVGDKLLQCLQSGSWDNSFPYCREKRQVTVPQASSSNKVKPTVGNAVQFPPAAAVSTFASTRVTATQNAATPAPPPMLASTSQAPVMKQQNQQVAANNLPASLNGLAGQSMGVSTSGPIMLQPPVVSMASNEIHHQSSGATPQPNQPQLELQHNRKPPGQSSSVSSIVQSPPPQQQQPPIVDFNNNNNSIFRQAATRNGSSMQASSSVVPGRQSSQAAGNRFATGSPSPSTGGYDSSPLATTNSISVHQQQLASSTPTIGQHHAHHPQQSTTLANPFAPPTTTTTTSSSTSTTLTSAPTTSASLNHNTGNVLASFSAPARGASAHNSLANAKYSLDGIIAMAIFCGCITLGVIVTVLVVIMRRRCNSQSSSIDAQTISTYDSNAGEHNGLYRNYQQAWENLRFSAPHSQPKSSGNGPATSGGLITGGPSIGLKNYASPAGVTMLHHAHAIHANGSNVQGHHNLGMSSSPMTTSSGSTTSSQSSSSMGVSGGAGSGGADPLLGPHHHSSTAAQQRHLQHQTAALLAAAAAHQQQQQCNGGNNDDDDDDDDDDEIDDEEEGVISADEANYRPQLHAHLNHTHTHAAHHHAHHAHHRHRLSQPHEGFRDSNELTINADTATLASTLNGMAGQAAVAVSSTRPRLYSTNSIGRSMASASNRRSLATNGGASSQTGASNRQSASSNSTRSSRASPASDEHSLDQLAYGHNWHHHPSGQRQ